MFRRLTVIILIVFTTGLMITGCPQSSESDSTLSSSSNGASSSTGPPPPVGTEIGNLAPDFQLQDLDGNTVSLSELRGSPVIINFWYTRCGWCVVEMPHLQAVYEEHSAKGLVLLAIDWGEPLSVVSQFKQDNNLTFTMLLDSDKAVSLKYDVIGYPTTYFIDKDGIIRAKKLGAFLSKEELEEELEHIMP